MKRTPRTFLVRLPADVAHQCASFLDVFDLPSLFDTSRSVRVMVIGHLRTARQLRLLQEVRGPAGAIDPASRWLRLLSTFTRNLHVLDLHGTRWTTNPGGDLLVPVIRANTNTLHTIDGVKDFSEEALTALVDCPELRRIGPSEGLSVSCDVSTVKCRKLESLYLHRDDGGDQLNTEDARAALRDLPLSRLHLENIHPLVLAAVVPTNLTELSLVFASNNCDRNDIQRLVRLVAEAPSLRIFRLVMNGFSGASSICFDLPVCQEFKLHINGGSTVPTFRAPRVSKLLLQPAALDNLHDLAASHPDLTHLNLETATPGDIVADLPIPVLPRMTSFCFMGWMSPITALRFCTWKSLTSLDIALDDHSLDTYAIAVLLSSLPSLVTAGFEVAEHRQYLNAGTPLPSLISQPTLTQLTLVNCNDDRLFAALHAPHLTKLDLLGSNTADLTPFLSRCPALIDLNVQRVGTTAAGMLRLPALRRLDCRDASPPLESTLIRAAPMLTALCFRCVEPEFPVVPASVEHLMLTVLMHRHLTAFRHVLQQLPNLHKLDIHVPIADPSFEVAVREFCPLVNLVMDKSQRPL